MKKRSDGEHNVLIESDDNDKDHIPRRPKRSFDQWPHVFNLTNCIVGVSVLAMPYCLQQCGILLGTVLIGVCSLLTKVTCHLSYQAAVHTQRMSYEGMAQRAFGGSGKRLIELLMVLFLLSSVVSFMVVIGDIGPDVLADYLGLQAPTQRLRILVMVLVFLFVILPLSLFRSLNSLSGISSVTVIFYFIFVLRMLFECIPRILDGKWTTDVHWWRQEGLLTSLPIISMALSCQTQLFCVADCMKEPSSAKVDTVVSGSVNICSGMYAAVGLFGYVAFHDVELHGDILLYLHSSFFTQLLKLAFMLSVAVSIPLMLFPSRIAFYNLFLRPDAGEFALIRMSSLTFISLTALLLTSSLFIAVTIPNVEFILGLTGALIGSLVTIIIPATLYIVLCEKTKDNTTLLMYAKLSVVIGALMLVGSTWAVLHTEQESNIIDVILPKQLDSDRVEDALKRLEKVKGEANVTIKQELEQLSPNKKIGKKELKAEDAQKILYEIKEQREEQHKILKEQKAIVDELKKHQELHVKLAESNEAAKAITQQKNTQSEQNVSTLKTTLKSKEQETLKISAGMITQKSAKEFGQTSSFAQSGLSLTIRSV